MSLNQVIAVLGGDARQPALCEYLTQKGFQVQVYGVKMPREVPYYDDWRETTKGAVAIILPLPASPDGQRLYMPLESDYEVPLVKDVFKIAAKRIVLGGKFSPSLKAMAGEMDVSLIDYFENEALQQRNALPTAEGAISILMREMPRTVSGMSVMVTGYGRVAKALIRLLLAMDARVTVTARKKNDILAARALGCHTVLMTGEDAIREAAKGQAVIFNTVPYWLFSDSVLQAVSPQTLIIDLASAPGGVDSNAAAARNIRVIWALSLPGKYAPATAGEIIGETVLQELTREGII